MRSTAPGGAGSSRLRKLVMEATDVAAMANTPARDPLRDLSSDSDAALAPAAAGQGVGRAVLGAASGSAPGAPAAEEPSEERAIATAGACELCATPLAAGHRHLWERARRTLLCVCRACALLFDRPEAAEGHLRLVPERVRTVADLDLDDATWDRLDLPVELAFFQRLGSGEGIVVYYPGALGAVEANVDAAEWAELEARNPVLRTIEAEVEALLVNRSTVPAGSWIVPLDLCYELVGVIRRHWKGLGGGEAVWEEVTKFFEALQRRAE